MERLFSLIYAAYQRPQTRIYKVTEGLIWFLIACSIGLFALELNDPQGNWLSKESAERIDNGILSIFAVDLALRILSFKPAELDLFAGTALYRARVHIVGRLRYCFSALILIDILTLLAFVPALRGLRALRLLRLLSGARLFRYSTPVLGVLRSFAENKLLYRGTFGMLMIVVMVGGMSLYLIEGGPNGPNKNLPAISDGIWWGLVTITTVGYGDVSPVTFPGKIIGGVIMVAGMFTLALFAGIVSTTILGVMFRLREEQFRMSGHANHIVVCGYDPGARMLLSAIIQEVTEPGIELIIIAPGERATNIPDEFNWVSGDPTKESELDKVKLTHARAALIVGARSKTPQEADATTILTAFTMRTYLKKRASAQPARHAPLYIVAEILDAENVEHAHTAGADEVIETTRLGFSLMAHSVLVPGSGEVMTSVASAGAHSIYIGKYPYPESLSFEEVSQRVHKRYGVVVLGIQHLDSGVIELGPKDEQMVNRGHGVVYLSTGAAMPSIKSSDSPS